MAKTRPKSTDAKLRSSKTQAGSTRASRAPASAQVTGVRPIVLICLFLAIVTLSAYWQVLGCKFVDFDDQDYVTNNPFITRGLGPGSVAWALGTFACGNWHPVTWISYMVDHRIHGLDPMGYHLTNLLLHIANTLILFLVLNRMTGAAWRSGFVAALFALHPLHVESVAWVAERKDVLSTFFWLLAMYAYAAYAQRSSIWRYLLIMAAFALSLMSKPMAVSLPIVLLLMDFWPLNRAHLRWRLVWEKAPLFAMSAGSSIITFIAQRQGGAVVGLDNVEFGYRIANSVVSYVAYIAKMIWPSGLAVFYPLAVAKMPMWQVVGAGLLLAAVSVLVMRNGRRFPYLAVGWLWYLITLVPVIGLVQVGAQAMADRYAYITLTGLFIIIAWGVPDLLSSRGKAVFRLLVPFVAMLILVLAACTWSQVGVWHSSYSLFDHAIKVTEDNSLAYNNRGVLFVARERSEEAIADFSKAVEIEPNYAEAHSNLGLALIESGRVEEGLDHMLTAVSLGFDTSVSHYGIAQAYFKLGKRDLAAEQCWKSLKLDPRNAAANNLMGMMLGSQGKMDEAMEHLKLAAECDPTYPDPHGNLAVAYFARRDYRAAWREVHVFQRKGGSPNPRFIESLSMSMPDPGP